VGAYFAAIWRCRYFWMSLVRMDLRTRYRGSMLGLGWSLLHPIAMTVILCTVFHKLFHLNVREYAPFLMAGLACWNYILTVTLQGCQCFFHGESYIRQYPAPLAIYPLRTALGGTIHFLLALLVACALAWYLNGMTNVLCLLSLVPSIGLLFLFVWSTALLAGFTNVCFQDTQHLAEVGFQILFYLTPIMYQADMLRENHLGWLVRINPIVPFLELIRTPVVNGHLPALSLFAKAGVVVIVSVVAAGVTVIGLQRRLIFRL
jgi:ABC-type polysaccharide/polyol phosphate export permease